MYSISENEEDWNEENEDRKQDKRPQWASMYKLMSSQADLGGDESLFSQGQNLAGGASRGRQSIKMGMDKGFGTGNTDTAMSRGGGYLRK